MLQATYLEYVNDSGHYTVIDENGYLLDPSDWSRAFTEHRARSAGIRLTEKHWTLIQLIRHKYLTLGALPPMRSICKAVGFDKHELKADFGSCLMLWKIAGLPDPGEEAKAYMS